MNITVLSVCTNNSPLLENFKKSLEINGYPYEILGVGEKWGGWNWRTRKYIEKMKNMDLNDVAILTDSTDVIFVQPKNVFIDKFTKMNARAVIGAETHCCTGKFSRGEMKLFATFTATNLTKSIYRYPNGGFICGYVKDLLEILDNNKDEPDDQAAYLEMHLNRTNLFVLDSNNIFVGNWINATNSDFVFNHPKEDFKYWKISSDGKYYNTLSNEAPVAFHFAGKNPKYYNIVGEHYFGKNFNKMREENVREEFSRMARKQFTVITNPFNFTRIMLAIIVIILVLLYFKK